jgi:putative inorganic carbon (HCO3(-)) transporter
LISGIFQGYTPDSVMRGLVSSCWLLLALLVGLLIAAQPPTNIVVLFALSVFLIAALMTPLALVAIVAILAPMRTLIATEASLQLPLDIGQLTLLGLITAWAVYRIARKQRLIQIFWSPLTIAIVIYIIITGFTALNATSLAAWLNDWLKWVQILILVVFVTNIVIGQRWEWLLAALVLGGVANAIIGIYEFFGGSGALHLLINNRFFRAFGTFGQPNPFGGFMGLLIPLALMAALGYALRVWRGWRSDGHISAPDLSLAIFYIVSSTLMSVGIGMSWSRGAWIGLGGALAVMVFALPRNTLRGLIAFGALFSIVALLWFAGLLPQSIVERLTTSTQEFFAFEDVRGIDITPENYAVAERLAHWQAALNMATQNPWLGVGLGNYEVVYQNYRLINWPIALGHAHNYYLNILAEAGVIGLLAYGKVWIVIIALSWRIRRHPDTLARLIGIGLLGGWVYLAIHSIFDNLYVNNLFLHLGLMLGILAVLYSQTSMYQRSKTV